MDPFDKAWDMLEKQSKCDAKGGAEYVRIRRTWERLVGLSYALDYIVNAANEPPTLPEVPPLPEGSES